MNERIIESFKMRFNSSCILHIAACIAFKQLLTDIKRFDVINSHHKYAKSQEKKIKICKFANLPKESGQILVEYHLFDEKRI